MPVKIRDNTFETNSSSQHVLVMFGNTDKRKTLNVINLELGEYGWNIEKLNTAFQKINYIATAVLFYEKNPKKTLQFLQLCKEFGIQTILDKSIEEIKDIVNEKLERAKLYTKVFKEEIENSMHNFVNTGIFGIYFILDENKDKMVSSWYGYSTKNSWSSSLSVDDFKSYGNSYYVYIDHQSDDLWLNNPFASSLEATREFILNEKYAIITGNDNGGYPLENYDLPKVNQIVFEYNNHVYNFYSEDLKYSLEELLYDLFYDDGYQYFEIDFDMDIIYLYKEYSDKRDRNFALSIPFDLRLNKEADIENGVFVIA